MCVCEKKEYVCVQGQRMDMCKKREEKRLCVRGEIMYAGEEKERERKRERDREVVTPPGGFIYPVPTYTLDDNYHVRFRSLFLCPSSLYI